jgi:murein DD-endopeptidase MepM/ murein hydrolase activator NlpD
LPVKWWLYLALVGFLGYVEPVPSWVRLLNLLFLWPLLRSLARAQRRRRGKESDKRAAVIPQLPLAPAAGSKALLSVRFGASTLLLFLWPPALVGQVRQLVGDRRAASRAIRDVSSYRQKVAYSLPFHGTAQGEWFVFNGGLDEETSHSWDVVAQRFAYDFVVVDDALRRWRAETEGRRLADYLCYGAPILAPADGVVVAVQDDIRDAGRPGTGWLDPFAQHIAGNRVVIEHAEGEYSFLAHLVPGSAAVRVGQEVIRGQEVARCGNSGNSSEPHLHFQVQDRADFFDAAGLPVAFDGVSVEGGESASGIYLTRGTRVRPSRG